MLLVSNLLKLFEIDLLLAVRAATTFELSPLLPFVTTFTNTTLGRNSQNKSCTFWGFLNTALRAILDWFESDCGTPRNFVTEILSEKVLFSVQHNFFRYTCHRHCTYRHLCPHIFHVVLLNVKSTGSWFHSYNKLLKIYIIVIANSIDTNSYIQLFWI